MRRREFVAGLAAATVTVADAARAQSAGKVYRLGVLAQSARVVEPLRSIVLPELAKSGFVEGVNLTVDVRAGADVELPRLAGEIVAGSPNAILTTATPSTRAARAWTKTIPIVMFGGEDAIAEGFADTIARPGGNVTAVVIMSIQLEAKRLQLLHEAVPSARRVGVLLYGGDDPIRGHQRQELRRAADALGLDLQVVAGQGPDDFPAAFAALTANGAQALLIGANTRLFQHRAELVELAVSARLPTVCEWASMARDGCLLGYGPDREVLYRNAATKLARLFLGAAPADLPVEQPTVFTFGVNLRTAKALGLEMPPSLLARADEVIE